jgi:primase-polymerase (primpol)-like protein
VSAKAGDGITYVLTPDDPFAALDVDHCRDPISGSIDDWAQRLLNRASHAYVEVSPSGTGLRIWGMASGAYLHRHFNFGSSTLELFRRARKPLTVTGLQIGSCQTLGNIDALLDHAQTWAEQNRQKLNKSRRTIENDVLSIDRAHRGLNDLVDIPAT